MKAKRRIPGQMVNPYYSNEDRRRTVAVGQSYDVPPFLTLPAGEVVDDPECWKLCIGPDAPLVPDDDECAQAVLKTMSSEKRKAFLLNLHRQDQAEVRKQMSRGQQEWLDEMLEVFGGEVQALVARQSA